MDLVALHAWTEAGVLDFVGMNWLTMRASEDEVLAERLAGGRNATPT